MNYEVISPFDVSMIDWHRILRPYQFDTARRFSRKVGERGILANQGRRQPFN